MCIVRDNCDKLDALEKLIIYKYRHIKILIVLNKTTDQLVQFGDIECISVCIKTRLNINLLRGKLGMDNLLEENTDRGWSIFGRANVGKSSVANLILGQNRFQVQNEIGTTLEVHSDTVGNLRITDTPGYRKNNTLPTLEKASQYRLEDYMESSGNGIYVLDASMGLTRTDRGVIDKLLNQFRLILVLNKIDLVRDRVFIVKEMNRLYPNLPIVEMSSINGSGIRQLKRDMRLLEREKEIKTSALNKVLHEEIKLSKIKYITRTDKRTFLLFSKSQLSKAETRYVEKVIANKFKLLGDRLVIEVRTN